MTVVDEKKTEDRGTWAGRLDFTMSALSFAVGMGNLWRFPYLCYRGGGGFGTIDRLCLFGLSFIWTCNHASPPEVNSSQSLQTASADATPFCSQNRAFCSPACSQGAFLIPYLIAMIIAGYPLMFIELALGQFGRQGVVSIWKACPLFQGIGWGMFSVSVFTGIYYNMIIAWCFFYMFASFASDVPWKSCDHDWNSPLCAASNIRAAMANCSAHNGTYNWLNKTCEWFSGSDVALTNGSRTVAVEQVKPHSPPDDFFHNYMLDISEGIHDMGIVRWQLALCLLLCWVIVFFSLAKGIKVSGKVTYVTALIPYAVLLILLVRGVTLEGSLDGILFYMTPRWEQLATAQVWRDAAVQVFFSLSLCWGGLITLASYNKFNNDCLRDTIVVATGDMLTSVFGGFVTFSIIGFMANELKVPVNEVATQGPGLVFIVYPEGIAQLPISPLWSVLFMLMLINVGIGSQMGIVSTVHTTLLDMFPNQLLPGRRKLWLLLGICCCSFLLGLSLCTRGGMYMLQLMDTYTASYALLILALAECIAISWFYGVNRFYGDIQQMLGRRISPWWKICWKFLSPAFVLFILVFIMADFKRTQYRGYVYPVIWEVLGWIIPVAIMLCIPITAFTKIRSYSRFSSKNLSLKQKIQALIQPTADWGQQTDYSSGRQPPADTLEYDVDDDKPIETRF